MKHTLSLTLRVLAIMSLIFCSSFSISETTKAGIHTEADGIISGFVYQADGITPIENAWVYVMDTQFQYIAGSNTLVDGSYIISGLVQGSYYEAVVAEGFGGVYYPNGYDDLSAELIPVNPPDPTININFTLSPEATISGFVYQSDGTTPLVGANISAWPFYGGQVRSTTSSTDGSYLIHGLSTGSYVAKADFAGYITEYYLNASDWSTATPIGVTQPQNTPNITFTLDIQGLPGAISGYVLDANSSVITDTQIKIRVYENTGGLTWDTNVSQVDGSYTVAGLTPGIYKVRANSTEEPGYAIKFFDDKLNWGDADLVEVLPDQTTTGINFLLEGLGSISGHVFAANGSVITDTQISVLAHDVSSGSGSRGTNISLVDGSYKITGLLPGTYRVQANNNLELGYVTKYYDNKLIWDEANPVEVVTNHDTPGIDFTLETGGAISGTVFQADGMTPIENAYVRAMDLNFQHITGVNTSADGSYVLGGLPQGSYYIAVRAEGFGGVYYPNGYDDPSAVPVAVLPPGITPDINFTISPEATLSGFVYQSDGITPIEGVWIWAWPRNGGSTRDTFTDSTGAFQVHGLTTGYYVAKAEADGYETEYYFDAYDWSSATAISVTQPLDTPGITFTLSAPAPLPIEEVEALEALFNSTDGNQWTNRDGWLVDPDPCTWYGVTCHDGHVVSLFLSNNLLSGNIPPELANLTSLHELFLSNNHLSGEIPTWLGSLSSLQMLFLTRNHLSGTIPLEIGNLASLRYFNAAKNQLTGAIPPQLGNLSALEVLYLAENHLTGVIPHELGNLGSLIYLGLSDNLLTGCIPPELGNIINLSSLFLNDNQLSGEIPVTLANLVNLDPLYGGFDLDYNRLYVWPDYPNPGDPLHNFLSSWDPEWHLRQAVTETIGSTGGVLISLDGLAKLEVPGGAVLSETLFTFAPQGFPSYALGLRIFANHSFILTAENASGPLTLLNKPVTLTLTYSDTDITSFQEGDLRVIYWDDVGENWYDASATCAGGSGYLRDLEHNILSLQLCHLSEFALVGQSYHIFLPVTIR